MVMIMIAIYNITIYLNSQSIVFSSTTTATITSTFDSLKTFNANRTSTIETPADAAARVVVEAIISGHGDCEFTPTAHFFEVNGDVYNVTFFGAGTAYGCQDQAIDGAEPNEHGTGYYGRDGWCDGAPVTPHFLDVTDSWLVIDPFPFNRAIHHHHQKHPETTFHNNNHPHHPQAS